MKPHKFRPHWVIRIFAPSLASHRPIGEPNPVSPLAARPATASATNAHIFMYAPGKENCALCCYEFVGSGCSDWFTGSDAIEPAFHPKVVLVAGIHVFLVALRLPTRDGRIKSGTSHRHDSEEMP